jgi:hypothetical protein
MTSVDNLGTSPEGAFAFGAGGLGHWPPTYRRIRTETGARFKAKPLADSVASY